MSNERLITSINSTNGIVALCTSDGVIKFYDTLSSTLKSEYTPSTHLQTKCSCLSWPKYKEKGQSSKKLKTDNDNIQNDLNTFNLIAIGTAQGTILLYSISNASLHSQLKDGHNNKVNDICWSPLNRDSLYSCSDDGQIIEWSLIESKLRNKWKCAKLAVTAIAIDQQSQYLLSASKEITLWNLENRSKLQTFSGHANDIFKLKFLDFENDQAFFISAACNDGILNLWQFDKKSAKKSSKTTLSHVTFTINKGDPIYVDVDKPVGDDKKLKLCVVSRKGNLCVFNHSIGEKIKTPISPSNEIKFETKDKKPSPLNVICCQQHDDDQILVAYGTDLAPRFEKLSFNDFKEVEIVLKRDAYKLNVSLETERTKIETPSVSKDVKVILPGYMGPLSNNGGNAKRKATEPSQMSIEERLDAMGIDGDIKHTQIPRADNLLMLLVQGLQSNDSKMLNHILQHKNDKIITKTIKLLSTNYIVPLFKELSKRLQGHAQSGLGIIKWLKCVLMIHTSFLMSYPDLIESLGSVYEMMNARTKLFPQLSKLQGKLQLVMSQVSAQAEAIQSVANPDAEALLLYQDSSSEDEQIEDELIPSHSEFDGEGDLFSDEDDDDEEDEEADDNNKMDEDGEKDSDDEAIEDDDDEEEEEEEESDDDEDIKLNKIVPSSKKSINNKKKTEIEDSDEDDDEITKKKIDAKKIVKNFDKKKIK